jgi:dUTPase
MEIPKGYMVKISNRSSVSSTAVSKKEAGLKVYDAPNGLIIGADTIDSDFQGEIKIHLINYSDNLTFICPGDKICQAIVLPVISCEIEEVEGDLFTTPTSRGEGEFGSSNATDSSNETIQEGHST